MVSEPSPLRPKRGRFTLRQVLIGIAAISVVLAAAYNFQQAREFRRLRVENERLSLEVEALKLEAELKQLENDLKVPMEALIGHYVPRRELDNLRQQALKKCGIGRYPQFASVYLNGASDFDLPVKPTEFYCDSSSKYFGACPSYEEFWLNHAPRTCSRLTDEMTRGKPLGKHLLENPTVFRKRFRPLLLRLVQVNNFWMRSEACEALIVGGDRTEAVLEAIRGILAEPKRNVTIQGQGTVQKFSDEKLKWIELNRRFDLGLPVVENEPVDAK